MLWTPEKIKIAKDILLKNKHMDVVMAQITTLFSTPSQPYVSLEAVRRAFRRAGEESPHKLLGGGLPVTSLAEYAKSVMNHSAHTMIKMDAKPTFTETSNEFFIDIVANNFKKYLRRNSVLLDGVKSGKMRVQVVSTVNKKTTRILVISDLHVPYHDVAAWNCVLQVIRETKPETVVIIGDFADMYSISSHPKSLDRKMNFATERDAVNAALDELRVVAGDSCRIVFCEGNHEDRITRFLQSSAPELGGIKEIRAEGLFRIKERNIEWVPYRTEIKIGNCAFTHDVGRCGVNTARQSLLDYGGNLVVGHSHRGACVYQGEVKGSSHFCLNVGWLGDVKAVDYVHRARAKKDWQTGFGFVDQDETGFSWATFVPVLDGRCVVDGKVFSDPNAETVKDAA